MPLITQGKTNWKFLLIVIILAVVVGVIALRCSLKKEQLYQPSEIETANWKTYKNDSYGFEFNYPNNHVFVEETDKDKLKKRQIIGENLLLDEQLLRIGIYTDKDNVDLSYGYIRINVYTNNNNFSLEQLTSWDFPAYPNTQKEVSFNGIRGMEQYVGGGAACWKEVSFLGNKMIYTFSFLGDIGGTNGCELGRLCCIDSAREAIFNEMLSTFRFIEDETAEWKTYRNEEVGIELKYPSDWKDIIFEKRNNMIDGWPGIVFLANDPKDIFHLSMFSQDYRPFESVILNKESVNVDWSLSEFISHMSPTGDVLFVKKLSPKSMLVAIYDAPECSPCLRLSVLTPLNNKNYPNLEISISFPFDKDPTIKEYVNSQVAQGLDACDELEPYKKIADKIYNNTYSDTLNSYIETARLVADNIIEE